MNRAKLKAALGVFLVFTTGVLVGVFGTTYFFKSRSPYFRNKPADKVAFIMNRLTRELELSQEQKSRIEKIVRSDYEANRAKSEERRKEARKRWDSLTDEIKKELSESQRLKLDQLREKWREKRDKREKERNKTSSIQKGPFDVAVRQPLL